MNRQTFTLVSTIAFSQIWICSSSAEAQRQTSQRPERIPMMGVSSAWNYGTDADHKTSVESATSKLNAEKIKGSITGAVSDNKAALAVNSRVGSQRSSFDIFDEKKMETMFDSWQIQAKHFFVNMKPRVVAFLTMASKKSGFVKGNAVPDLQMAENRPSTVKVHLQPVSNTHGAWLMRDGRLKTVASH